MVYFKCVFLYVVCYRGIVADGSQRYLSSRKMKLPASTEAMISEFRGHMERVKSKVGICLASILSQLDLLLSGATG